MTRRDVFVLVPAAIGVMAGLYLSFTRQTVWYALGQPPAPAEQINAATPDTIIVLSSDGKIYSYKDTTASYWHGGAPSGAWVPGSGKVESWAMNDCQRNMYIPDDGQSIPVKDSLACNATLFNTKIGIVFTIREDGSVWRWVKPSPADALLRPPVFGALGGALGLLLGGFFLNLAGSRFPASVPTSRKESLT